MQEISDEHIIAMLQQPQEQERGFSLLMQRYQERLYWHIRRMVHQHEDANDLLQNTFVKVFKGFHTYEKKSKLYTWLYRIATNETLTFLQKQKQYSNISIDDATQNVVYDVAADTYFDGNAAQVALKKAIAKLPEKQCLVFNMRYYDELPYEEMSKILGTSVGALKASFHHAVKKIEEELKKENL